MSRTRSRRTSLALAALPALGAALLAAPEARAQTPSGWALDRFEPTPTGDVFFMAEHPWYSSTRYFAAGIVGDYAFNPLVLRQTLPTGEVRNTDVISGMFVGHVGVAASFLDRVGLHLSLPISLLQDGTTTTAPTVTLGPSSNVAPGDLRIGARVRILGHADRDPISLHLGVMVWAPIGTRADNTGDETVRVEPRLTLAGRGGPVRWSFGGGFTVRGDIDAENLAIGNELRLTAAVGIAADHGRLTIGPEAYVVTSIRDLTQGRSGSSAFAEGQWGGEAILGAHYTIADQVMVGLGGGFGMERGYGIPAGRLLFSVAYAPIRREQAAPSDRDGDGVLDRDDICPDTHMGPHPDPNRRGCPLIDTDSDGVFDPDDICPTVPQGDHPDPQRRGCPTPDSDGDGVLDPDDQRVTTCRGSTPTPSAPAAPTATG
ncbi:MAG: transporter [Polyangiales bacterium]